MFYFKSYSPFLSMPLLLHLSFLVLALAFYPTSAFVAPKLYLLIPKQPTTPLSINTSSCSSRSRRGIVRCASSSRTNFVEQEEDDGSFFLQASQQAAQERMQQLKDGTSPLAISLSTTTTSSKDEGGTADTGDVGEEKQAQEKEYNGIDVDELLQAVELPDIDTASTTEVKKVNVEELLQAVEFDTSAKKEEPPMPLTEGLTAEEAEQVRMTRVSGSKGEEVKGNEETQTEIAQISEGQTADEAEMVRKARLEAADREAAAKTLKQTQSAMGGAAVEGGATTEKQEEKVPIDPFKERQKKQQQKSDTPTPVISEDDIAPTDKSEDQTVTTATPEEESQSTKLSTDGKQIFEPSKSALEMNEENISMGLLVLTRAMLSLQSIVDRKGEE